MYTCAYLAQIETPFDTYIHTYVDTYSTYVISTVVKFNKTKPKSQSHIFYLCQKVFLIKPVVYPLDPAKNIFIKFLKFIYTQYLSQYDKRRNFNKNIKFKIRFRTSHTSRNPWTGDPQIKKPSNKIIRNQKVKEKKSNIRKNSCNLRTILQLSSRMRDILTTRPVHLS